MMELTKRLRLHLHDQNISLSAIHNRGAPNPFPIGRLALERIVSGREVSDKLKDKLEKYLDKFKPPKN
jgi:phosphotransferase system IIB component